LKIYLLKKSVIKECIICFKSINECEYINHVQSCSSERSPSIQTSLSSNNINIKTTQDCIICFKPIHLSEYENHVLACVAQIDNQSHHSTTNNNLKCLTW